jgi:hypothetical protein
VYSVRALRTIYRYWTAVLFLAVLVEIGAAGYGAFNAKDKSDPGPLSKHQFTNGFDFHNGFGYFIFLATVVLLLLALGARLGKRRVLMVLAAPLLLIVQILLARAGETHPIAGIFHPLNALLIFAVTGSLAHEAWWGTRRPAAAGAPTTPNA